MPRQWLQILEPSSWLKIAMAKEESGRAKLVAAERRKIQEAKNESACLRAEAEIYEQQDSESLPQD